MGALPKTRISRSRRGHRRLHQHIEAPHLVHCPNCRAYKQQHHICLSCGFYAGRQVVEIELRAPSTSSEGPPN